MGKNKWMSYNRSCNIIEIKIKDEGDKLIDHFKCNNKKAFENIASIIRNKYGYNFAPEINQEESINNIKKKESEGFLSKDIKW